MSPQKVYELYHGLTLHFSSPSYDFHKFNGKIKSKTLKEEDKNFWFYKSLGETYSDKDLFGLFLSNIISSSPLFIKDLFEAKARETFLFWKSKIENKYDVLLLECKYIKKNFGLSLDNIKEDNSKTLLSLFYRNNLSIESLVLLFETFPALRKNEKEDIVFDLLLNKIFKYSSFIKIDCEKVKRIVDIISF